MSLTLYTADGTLITAEDGPPYQYTPAGFNSWLSTNSVPLQLWGAGVSYSQMYRTQPWVAVLVNKLVRQIARLPLKTYERDSQNSKQRVREGLLPMALEHPAQRKAPIDLKQWLAFPLVLHGNSVVRKTRTRAGAPTSGFERIEWQHVEPPRQGQDFWVWRKPGEKAKPLQRADVVHLAWLPPDGDLGVSPLEQLGVTLRVEEAAQIYQHWAFKNSVRPSGSLKLPPGVVLDKETRAEIRADLQQINAGPQNAGRPLLLPGGIEWQPMSHTAHEAELIEQRKLAREEVAAVYDVPPPMVGILDKATYSNIAEQHKMLFTTVLAPWLVLIEEQLKAQVIDGEFDGQWVEFDLHEVLRGDPVKEATALRTQLQSGVLTINEAREINNRPPIDHPNANRPMVPTNNVSFIGDEPAEENDANQLADQVDQLEQAMARVSPDFAAALETA